MRVVSSKKARKEPSSTTEDNHLRSHESSAECCTPDFDIKRTKQGANTTDIQAGSDWLRYQISNMDCPTEEALIRNRLEAMPQVSNLQFDLLDRVLSVQYQGGDTQVVENALLEIGMKAKLLDAGASIEITPPAISKQLITLLVLSGLTALTAEIVAWKTGDESSITVILLAVVSILSAGLPTLKKGWVALKNLTLNIYFLMSLAVFGAMLIGQWPEAAMVVFLFAIAEAIEALSLERARNAIKSLTALAPDTAYVYTDNCLLYTSPSPRD